MILIFLWAYYFQLSPNFIIGSFMQEERKIAETYCIAEVETARLF